MKKRINNEELFLLVALIIISLLIVITYFSKNRYENINIDSYTSDNDVYLEVLDVEIDNNYLVISGVTCDLSQEYTYNNYMMGVGTNLYRDFKILIITDDIYEVYTESCSIKIDGNIENTIYEKSDFGFIAKFSKELLNNSEFRIGVLYKTLEGAIKYKLLEDEYAFELFDKI